MRDVFKVFAIVLSVLIMGEQSHAGPFGDIMGQISGINKEMAAINKMMAGISKIESDVSKVSAQMKKITGKLKNVQDFMASAKKKLPSLQPFQRNELKAVLAGIKQRVSGINSKMTAPLRKLKNKIIGDLNSKKSEMKSAEKETAPLIVNLKNKKKEEAAVETFAENWVANHHSAPACTNAAYSLKQLEINAAAKKGAPGRLMHKDGDLNKAITSVSTESKKLTIAVKKEVKEFNVEGFCKSLDKITTTLLPKARNILDVKAPDLVNSTIENTNKWYTEIRSFKDHCCNASVGGGIQYSVLGHEFGFKDYVQVRPFLEAKINTAADDVTYSSNQVEKGDGYATKAANGTQYADNTFQEHSAIFPGMKSWSEYKDLISAANDLDTAAGEVKTGANDLSKAAGKAKKAANLAHEGTKEMDKVCNKLLPEEERLVVSFCDKALGAKTKKTGSIPKGRKSYDNVLGDIKTGLKNANSEIKKNWSWLQYVYDPPKPPLYQQTKPMTLAQICAKQKTPVIMPSPPLAGLELVPISSLHFTTQGCPTAPPAKK